MTVNEQLADLMSVELQRAMVMYLTNQWTAEQYINRLRIIFKSASL